MYCIGTHIGFNICLHQRPGGVLIYCKLLPRLRLSIGQTAQNTALAYGCSKGKRHSKRQQQKGTGKAGISPDRQEDREGLPYLVIQAVIPDGLNIHLIYMAQDIQSISLGHITQNPHCQPGPCHQTTVCS